VYKWFYLAYYACSSLGYLGYVVMLLEIVGITRMFHDGADVFQVGMLLAFYGLYFGVLSRDIADLCSDTIAQNLGVSPGSHTRRPGRREWALTSSQTFVFRVATLAAVLQQRGHPRPRRGRVYMYRLRQPARRPLRRGQRDQLVRCRRADHPPGMRPCVRPDARQGESA